ncbi:hypothetical protein [Sulfobacillus thermosulfidooxidans]|nr:hypothetical protein [Sulfobacillus thermosulfidooxidans]
MKNTPLIGEITEADTLAWNDNANQGIMIPPCFFVCPITMRH